MVLYYYIHIYSITITTFVMLISIYYLLFSGDVNEHNYRSRTL